MKRISLSLTLLMAAASMWPQNSLPAPGSGGGFSPAPSGGPAYNPGPPPPVAWNSPWDPGWSYSPSVVVNVPVYSDAFDSGTTKVVGCGYDNRGIWRTIPMTVSYTWNGAQYEATVVSAWNPWTDMWNRGIDAPAYNTSYYLNGTDFDFYAVLSTGTYYFNL